LAKFAKLWKPWNWEKEDPECNTLVETNVKKRNVIHFLGGGFPLSKFLLIYHF
jgi:hypothetical protein